MKLSIVTLIQFFGISTLTYLTNCSPAQAVVKWSEVTADPTGGLLLIPKKSHQEEIKIIDSITPKDLLGNTISVNTVFSAINEETRDFDKALPLISAVGLANVQSKISKVDAALTLLNSAVNVFGSIVKNDTDDVANTVNFNAVVSSDDKKITGINLTFSGVALVEAEKRRFWSDGGSFAEIGVSTVTLNGEEFPIQWSIKSAETEQETAEKIIKIPVPKSDETKSLIYQISGTGQLKLKTPIPPSTERDVTRGVLTIGALRVSASEDRKAGGNDTLAAIALTNWTATVQTECILNNPAPQSGGLKKLAAVSDISNPSDCRDYGDAPDSYKTLLASNGPRYEEGDLQRLGAEWDIESDGQPTIFADGDDRGCGCNGELELDDEDGVIFGKNWVDVILNITRSGVNNYQLSAWWDTGKDGVFDHPSERYINELLSLAPGIHKMRFGLSFNPKDFYSRFRLTWEPTQEVLPFGEVLSSDGISHGEVEDYPPRDNLPVPEPSSTLSFLALGTLGVGTIIQRSKKQKFAEK